MSEPTKKRLLQIIRYTSVLAYFPPFLLLIYERSFNYISVYTTLHESGTLVLTIKSVVIFNTAESDVKTLCVLSQIH